MLEINPHQTVTVIHHNDEDGLFSGMLVQKKYPQSKLYGMNYGREFDFNKLGEFTFVVDFSFDSIDTLRRISERTTLIWIDHHQVIDQAIKANFNPPGLRRKDVSAAKLVWEYLYSGEQCPLAIQYISDYDTWNWDKNINALYFHYGLGMIDLKPNDRKSVRLFETILTDLDYVERICITGKKINDFIQLHNKIVVDDGAFETKLDGINSLACNIKNTNSLVFDSMNEKYKDFPLRILFSYFANIKKFRVSVFSIDSEHYPAHQIAMKFGGGGHPGAAGFTCTELPFELPKSDGSTMDNKNIIIPLLQCASDDPLIRRYFANGNIPLVWSHQYAAVVGGHSAVVINHPTTFQDAFYSTGLNNVYGIGVFVHVTKNGWYRYRIYVLNPKLDIQQVCKDLNDKFEYGTHTKFVIDRNTIIGCASSSPSYNLDDEIPF